MRVFWSWICSRVVRVFGFSVLKCFDSGSNVPVGRIFVEVSRNSSLRRPIVEAELHRGIDLCGCACCVGLDRVEVMHDSRASPP